MKAIQYPILNRIKKQRKIMGYTQKDIAYLLDLSDPTNISRWENGLTVPGIIMLFKLSIILRSLPTELYFELIQEIRGEVMMREMKYLETVKADDGS